ncbi:hypothetical protein [Acinetobacter baumannii]|uniref:hypothetical protein n=1 Tax=Acinetobacter baumannii TaxID=470 RepID=UPI000DE721A0|nr:hypothetical protein [Acinetobacter baumannii]SSS75974.1 Uncharacterised protein [Acinetobacter baumannii]
MIEMNDSTGSINGHKYDFTGYNATLNFDGEITKVIEISTGKNVTEEFKEKYGQLSKGEG